VAGGTDLLAMHIEPRLTAANRRPEIHRCLVFQVAARLRAARLLLLRPGEHAGEDVLEAAPTKPNPPANPHPRVALGAARPALEAGKVEAVKIHRSAATATLLPRIGLGRRRIDLVRVVAHLVVNLALLLVGSDYVVSLGDLLELFLGALVAGVHISG